MTNKNMLKAKKTKNDEFYTKLTDIEKEVNKYREHFEGKTVFMNCDDPEKSNFYKFFVMNFKKLKLKKIISTHYEKDGQSYKLEISGDHNGNGVIDKEDTQKTMLNGDGDFRSPECIDLLKEADIVVTNPPFSIFREFITLLVEHDKKFLVIGNKNAITYKEVFKLIKENKLWLGYNSPKEFDQPDGEIKKFGNIGWFTNLETKKRTEELILTEKYYGNEEKYLKYDNYDAINVDKVKDIPMDYFGYMGVPITFLDKHCPNQFEIIGCSYDYGRPCGWSKNINMNVSVDGKNVYKRLLIKRKENKQ